MFAFLSLYQRHFLSGIAGAILALLILLLFAEPAQAATFAGVSDFFRSFARRDRVIQLCVVAMLIGLFVMLKKFNSDDTMR